MTTDTTNPATGVKFSETPMPSAGARRKETPVESGELPPEIAWFRATYIHERRVVEALQSPVTKKESEYRPAPSLDGQAMSASIEDKPKANAWV
jgi:hypothetical protein